ncbi:MAG: VOC family protein [Acidimicrobiales bacterium]
MTTSSSTDTYLVSDPTGIRYQFKANGATDGTNSYNPYGQCISCTVKTSLGFEDGYTDANGLIYLVNRDCYRWQTRTMTSRIAAISIAAVDPRRVAEFWSAALGWEILLLDSTGADIGPPNGLGPIIEFGLVPEKKTMKNRLHFDLRADGSTQSNELRRLLDLGAQRVDVGQTSEATWVVLADPEGNEFCLLSRSVQEVPADS